MTQESRRHFSSIDALRGFAALSVVLFHLGGIVLPKLSSPRTAQLTSWGWTGVEVFFVISGFVIPFVMLKADYRWQDSGQFLARRLIRIWPPSAVLISLTVLQYVVIDYLDYGNRLDWSKLSVASIAANLFYVVPFTAQNWLNGVLWTLAVEFQFYLFLALAFPLLSAHRTWLAIAGFASLLTALAPFAEVAQFLKYAIYFAMGGVALLYREGRIGRGALLSVLVLMTLVATIELGWLPSSFAAGTTLVIAFVPIRNRPFIFLGTISYSLYLTHILIASSTEFLLVRAFGPETAIERFAAQLICLGMTIIGAWLFYLLVERHFVSWSQRFAGHVARRSKQHADQEIIWSERT